MYIQTTGLKSNTVASPERGSSIGALGQPVSPNNAFSQCSDTQKKAIQAAFVTAFRSVNHAASILGSVYGRPDRMTQTTRDLLNRHFHTTNRGDVLQIFRNIFRIGQALQTGLDFKCMGYCGSNRWCGYAWATQWFGGRGSIQLCFDNRLNQCSFIRLSPQSQAATIIHETAHRHVGIHDKAYVWENSTNTSRDYGKLTSKQAVDNADSYAWFCVDLSAGP